MANRKIDQQDSDLYRTIVGKKQKGKENTGSSGHLLDISRIKFRCVWGVSLRGIRNSVKWSFEQMGYDEESHENGPRKATFSKRSESTGGY